MKKGAEMTTDMKRFMLTISRETAQCLDELKRNEFYDKPFAELYRYVLDKGIEAIKLEKLNNQARLKETTHENTTIEPRELSGHTESRV